MESQPQNPEFRTNPENFHPCMFSKKGHSWIEQDRGYFSYISIKLYIWGKFKNSKILIFQNSNLKT